MLSASSWTTSPRSSACQGISTTRRRSARHGLDRCLDLHNPKRDYEKVEAVLKAVDGSWAHPQGSLWFLDTLREASWWRDRLKAAMDANDEVFVARLHGSWAFAD